MKKGKYHLHLLVVLMGLLMLFGAGMTASAEFETAVIGGVEYTFYDDRTALASIDDVRGDRLPTELYIPRKIKYKNVDYKVEEFWWCHPKDSYRYTFALGEEPVSVPIEDDVCWRLNVVIPDKSRSYHACLKKITFARGVKVWGEAYDYEELKRVVLENPNDLEQASFYNCPKLKRLHLPKGFRAQYRYDVKNCPSLKVTVDKNHKRLKVIENNLCSKSGTLVNASSGKKYYKVPKGIKEISKAAFWGDTTIEKIHLRKAKIRGISGLSNLKRIKVDKYGSGYDSFYWPDIAYCPSLRRIDLPESICRIYDWISGRGYVSETIATTRHVYLYSQNLKDGTMRLIPAGTTFHVRNKKVAKQLRKFGFKGNIVVEKNMK